MPCIVHTFDFEIQGLCIGSTCIGSSTGVHPFHSLAHVLEIEVSVARSALNHVTFM